MSAEHDHAEAELRESLLDAALMHVPFDGWSDTTFHAAVQDAGADEVLARAVFPRGAVDLAVAYHKRGDALMLARLASEDPTFNDAKFLALSGQPVAAAEQLVTLAEHTSGAAEPIPERDRASLLRSAGDILVPSNPEKALATYRKAQELDPDNPILATRIQQLSAQTAAANTVATIPIISKGAVSPSAPARPRIVPVRMPGMASGRT